MVRGLNAKLLQTSGNAFIFSDFIKSLILLNNKVIIFYKIICFTKQIYHFFIKACVLLSKFTGTRRASLLPKLSLAEILFETYFFAD